MKKILILAITAIFIFGGCLTTQGLPVSSAAPTVQTGMPQPDISATNNNEPSQPNLDTATPNSSNSGSQNNDSVTTGGYPLVNQTQGVKGALGGIIVSKGGLLEYIEGDSRVNDGFIIIVGEIANHSNIWARTILLNITLYDDKGVDIFHDKGISAAGGVAPGTRTPFKYIRDTTKIKGKVSGYAIVASATETPALPVIDIQGLKAIREDNGYYTATGTAVNMGKEACSDPQVVLIGKQSNGKLYDLANIVLQNGNELLATLNAGDKSEFRGLLDSAGKISSVDVIAGCN